MFRARSLLVIVLLLSYGALGARQPAVRGSARLPVSAQVIADATGLPSADPSTLLLNLTRLLYDGTVLDSPRLRALRTVMTAPGGKTHDQVPLPLDPSIWRDTLLERQVPDQALITAIVSDRRASLVYHGLASLDDETLGWLGPDRDTLRDLRSHPGIFAVFGRSLHVRAGRVLVPGGPPAEALWESVVGASPARPSSFVQHLFRDDRAAYFYDTIAHLDPARQKFALGLQLPEASQEDRFYALFELFRSASPDWTPEAQPFSRPPLDPGLVLATIGVNERGTAAGPMNRRLWDRVFRGDEKMDVEFSAIDPRDLEVDEDAQAPDAATLVAQVTRAPYHTARRRLDTLLFAQRVFGALPPDHAGVATALRGFVAYPALMLTLERMGITTPAAYTAACAHAASLDAIMTEPVRRAATTEFQSTLGIVERISRTGMFKAEDLEVLTSTLFELEVSPDRAYEGRLAQWLGATLMPMLPRVAESTTAPVEETIVAAMAGIGAPPRALTTIEWEGARYRLDPAGAELARLRRIRRQQGGPSLDTAIAATTMESGDGRSGKAARRAVVIAEQAYAETLASILYAAYLSDPGGPGVRAGNAALRHDIGATAAGAETRTSAAWRLPEEDASSEGWRLRGSLLGLDAALDRLALRRLDRAAVGRDANIGAQERVALNVTASLLNPFAMTDGARDEIAAALGRGRARVAALGGSDADIERVAREAGLSEWRRMALAWTVEHNHTATAEQFSLLELFWLGAPRPGAHRALDAWGSSMLQLTGCLCLGMPRVRPWEDLAGRRLGGATATRAVDVALRVAEALASLNLPASLAPEVIAFALQDVTEHAPPAYPDDWQAFSRAARPLPLERLADYIAALTADGPLVPVNRAF